MDYARVYAEFIADRRLKEGLVVRGERHHVTPRCHGGGDDPNNLVRLTYSDHLFAHAVLAKVHPSDRKLACCLVRMSGMARYSGGRQLRNRYQAAREAMRIDEKTRRKIGAAKRGQKHSEATKQRLREANLGKTVSKETREKMSAALRGRVRSAVHCESISKSRKGRRFSSEARAKMSESAKRSWADPQKRAAMLAGQQEARKVGRRRGS